MCWCRGSVAETIFQPLIASIERSGGSIQGVCNHSQHRTLLQDGIKWIFAAQTTAIEPYVPGINSVGRGNNQADTMQAAALSAMCMWTRAVGRSPQSLRAHGRARRRGMRQTLLCSPSALQVHMQQSTR